MLDPKDRLSAAHANARLISPSLGGRRRLSESQQLAKYNERLQDPAYFANLVQSGKVDELRRYLNAMRRIKQKRGRQ